DAEEIDLSDAGDWDVGDSRGRVKSFEGGVPEGRGCDCASRRCDLGSRSAACCAPTRESAGVLLERIFQDDWRDCGRGAAGDWACRGEMGDRLPGNPGRSRDVAIGA